MKSLARFASAVLIVLGLSAPLSAQAPAAKAAKVDLGASEVLWTGKKVLGSHNGSVKLKSATLEVAGNDIAKAEFEIDMTSIKVLDLTDADSNGKLTGHLKSDDFFAVDKNPVATFKSTSIKTLPVEAGKPTHEVTGDLTIKGTTKPITFPLTVKVEGGKATATGSISVDRTAYDIRYRSGKFFSDLGDKVIDDMFKVDVKIVAGL